MAWSIRPEMILPLIFQPIPWTMNMMKELSNLARAAKECSLASIQGELIRVVQARLDHQLARYDNGTERVAYGEGPLSVRVPEGLRGFIRLSPEDFRTLTHNAKRQASQAVASYQVGPSTTPSKRRRIIASKGTEGKQSGFRAINTRHSNVGSEGEEPLRGGSQPAQADHEAEDDPSAAIQMQLAGGISSMDDGSLLREEGAAVPGTAAMQSAEEAGTNLARGGELAGPGLTDAGGTETCITPAGASPLVVLDRAGAGPSRDINDVREMSRDISDVREMSRDISDVREISKREFLAGSPKSVQLLQQAGASKEAVKKQTRLHGMSLIAAISLLAENTEATASLDDIMEHLGRIIRPFLEKVDPAKARH
jgi:hypothetical protein